LYFSKDAELMANFADLINLLQHTTL